MVRAAGPPQRPGPGCPAWGLSRLQFRFSWAPIRIFAATRGMSDYSGAGLDRSIGGAFDSANLLCRPSPSFQFSAVAARGRIAILRAMRGVSLYIMRQIA